MGFGTDPASFDPGRWAHGAQSFGPSLRLVAETLGLPLDSVEATGEVAVARRDDRDRRRPAGGRHRGRPAHAGRGTAGRPAPPQLRGQLVLHDRPRAGLGPSPDGLAGHGGRRRPPGRRDAVRRAAGADGRAASPGYTANRAVNAVPVVCAGSPGIRTTVDLPQIIGHPRDRERHETPARATPATEWFWTSGADGRLRIQGCTECGALVHPPVPICPVCRSRAWEPTVVSGRGTIVGYTVNHHQWHPDFAPPYAVAVVALAEEPGVRLTTMIVGCEPTEVAIGQEVAVRFEHHEDVWLPLFAPTGALGDGDPVAEPERPTPRRSARPRAVRAPFGAVRRGAVGPRSPADGRPALADRRRLPGGGGRRRAGARRTSTACRPTPGRPGWG